MLRKPCFPKNLFLLPLGPFYPAIIRKAIQNKFQLIYARILVGIAS